MTSWSPRGVGRLPVLAALAGLVVPLSTVLVTVVTLDPASASLPAATERVPAQRYLTAAGNKKVVVKGK